MWVLDRTLGRPRLGAAAAMAGHRVKYALAAKLVNEDVEAADENADRRDRGTSDGLAPRLSSLFARST